jgi:hypothetical protein
MMDGKFAVPKIYRDRFGHNLEKSLFTMKPILC